MSIYPSLVKVSCSWAWVGSKWRKYSVQFSVGILVQIHFPDALIVAQKRIAGSGQLNVAQRSTGQRQTAALTSAVRGQTAFVDLREGRNDAGHQRGVQKNIPVQQPVGIRIVQTADDMAVQRVTLDTANIYAQSALTAHVQRRHGKACTGHRKMIGPISRTARITMKTHDCGQTARKFLGSHIVSVDSRAVRTGEGQVKAVQRGVAEGSGSQLHLRVDGFDLAQTTLPVFFKINRLGIDAFVCFQLRKGKIKNAHGNRSFGVM